MYPVLHNCVYVMKQKFQSVIINELYHYMPLANDVEAPSNAITVGIATLAGQNYNWMHS